MTLYNITELTDSSTIGDMITAANSYSGGTWGTPMLTGFLLIAVFFAVFFGLKKYSFKDAFTAAGAICALLSVFLLSIGALNFLWSLPFFIIAGLGIALHFLID